MKKVVTIIGAGKGVSLGVARKFGKEGYTVALISRTEDKLKKLVQELKYEGIDAGYAVADASLPEEIESALKKIKELIGATQVLVYNAARLKAGNILNETSESLTEDFKINVANVITAVKYVIPDMEPGAGSILLTGGGLSIHPIPQYGSLAVGKAGIRNLAVSLNHALLAKRIYVGTITISGIVRADDDKYNPDKIGEEYWKLFTEKKDIEVIY
ncbi:SDR family NAD(P)-dependent oxidoreductase [Sporocytophaga myxococcoides]|uniref:SDR family NAD(P)-dependent oxidoreductase n=1 Tax=Sporocytophaga myxococcoides TaxID=153721 RepID=UPI0004043582|nr:SDR family NAD(P)-dependent oxidoreductase [Sporocytophaga myxococcoides]